MGLGSTTCVEHYIIYLQQDRHRGAAIYYGFVDQKLTQPPAGDWSTLIARRAFVYYTDLETALSFYLPTDPLQAWLLRCAARFPMLVERSTLWEKVELLRRALEEIGMPPKKQTVLGRVEDFALLEPDLDEFLAGCRSTVENRRALNGPVRAFFQRAKDQGVPCYVISMPLRQRHRRVYYGTPEWKAYEAYLVDQIHSAGGVFVPASDWIEDDGFEDVMHLNPSGAEAFSAKLARWVAEYEKH